MVLLAIVGLVATGCGGGSGSGGQDPLIQIAEDHQNAFAEYDAAGVCEPMSRNAAAEFEEEAESAIEADGGSFESDIPSSANEYCEYVIYSKRDQLFELREDEPAAAALTDFLNEANRRVSFDSVDVDGSGILATVSTKEFLFKELGILLTDFITEDDLAELKPEEREQIDQFAERLDSSKLRGEYDLVKEDGEWSIEEGRTILSPPNGETEELTFFPLE